MEHTVIDTATAVTARPVFIVSRDELLGALQFFDRNLIERRNTIPILSCVLFDVQPGRLRLRGTDLDIQAETELASADIDMPGAFAVEIAALLGYVASCPKGSGIGFGQLADNRLSVSCGAAAIKLGTRKPDDFPELNMGEPLASFSAPAAQWHDDMQRVGHAVSTEESRYYLNGIFAHAIGGQLAMAATDGHRLARVIRPIDVNESLAALMPRKMVKVMAKLAAKAGDDVALAFAKAQFSFRCGPWSIVSKLIDGTFPDYHRVIPPPAAALHLIETDADTLASACKAFDAKRGLTIEASADGMLYGKAGPGGFAAALPGTYCGDGVKVSFNASYLGSIAAIVKGSPVTVTTGGHDYPALIEAAAYPELTLVLMPMRIDDDLPVPADAIEPAAYVPPPGQAACLFGVDPINTTARASGYRSNGGPRKATRTEVEAYARDYARRCGAPGWDDLPADFYGDSGPVGVVTFGACVEGYSANRPAQYETGAFCIMLPGARQSGAVTVSIDGAPAQSIMPDDKGSVGKALTAIVGKDVPLSRAEKAAMRGATVKPVRKAKAAETSVPTVIDTPADVVAEPSALCEADLSPVQAIEPVEPAVTPADPVIVRSEAESVPADPVLPDAEPAGADMPDGEADAVATLAARVAALEAMVAGLALLGPAGVAGVPDAEPARRTRSAAHVRAIMAYLRLRKRRAGLTAGLAFTTAQYEAAQTRAGDLADQLYNVTGHRDRLSKSMDAWQREALANADSERLQRAKRRRAIVTARDFQRRLYAEHRLVDRLGHEKSAAKAEARGALMAMTALSESVDRLQARCDELENWEGAGDAGDLARWTGRAALLEAVGS